MARLWLLLALTACRGADELERAEAMLSLGGPVERSERMRRVSTKRCYAARAAEDVAPSLRADLEAAGWREVVVERHPAIAGRWSVRGGAPGLALAGVLETSAACAGTTLSLGALAVPVDADRRTAGTPRWRPRITP